MASAIFPLRGLPRRKSRRYETEDSPLQLEKKRARERAQELEKLRVKLRPIADRIITEYGLRCILTDGLEILLPKEANRLIKELQDNLSLEVHSSRRIRPPFLIYAISYLVVEGDRHPNMIANLLKITGDITLLLRAAIVIPQEDFESATSFTDIRTLYREIVPAHDKRTFRKKK